MNADDRPPRSRWSEMTKAVRALSPADGAMVWAGGGIGLVAMLIVVETLVRWGLEVASQTWRVLLILLSLVGG